jgi:hypothetical protein
LVQPNERMLFSLPDLPFRRYRLLDRRRRSPSLFLFTAVDDFSRSGDNVTSGARCRHRFSVDTSLFKRWRKETAKGSIAPLIKVRAGRAHRAGNEIHFACELAASVFAHVIGDTVEQAYRRSDALERRRGLIEALACYCEPL